VGEAGRAREHALENGDALSDLVLGEERSAEEPTGSLRSPGACASSERSHASAVAA